VTTAVAPPVPLPGDAPVTDVALLPLAEVLGRLGCRTDGLATADAAMRLAADGPNRLAVAGGTRLWASVVHQLVHPLALLLWAAAVLAATTQGPTLAVAILVVIALNAAFAVVQERHAEHAVEALAAYLPPQATVVRDGRRTSVPAADVVVGDVLVLDEGGSVCADAKLVSGSVEVDMSAVTGESEPVLRTVSTPGDGAGGTPQTPARARVAEVTDLVLSGTTCSAGAALGLVVHTGMATELGRIATLSSRGTPEPSPLERQVRKVAWLIAAVATTIGVAFLPLGVAAGLSFTEAAVFAIGLLVANVPEGLLPTITLALAVGVSDLARHGGLVKRLSAIETLGSTDVVCTDKTGTLTQNRMHLHSVWDATAHHVPTPDERRALATVLVTCTTADPATGTGDPTEVALLQVASQVLTPDEVAAAAAGARRTFRFDPRLRLMTAVVGTNGGTALTKGAPEAVLQRSTDYRDEDGETRPLDDETRAQLTGRLDDLAARGLRLIACARRDLDAALVATDDRDAVEHDLTLLGFVALSDPLRESVSAAVARAHDAGITVHVITGDNGRTAVAIAAAAGIGTSAPGGPRLVTGDQVDAMTEAELDALLASGEETVFAAAPPRTS
jgi:magnesium-transporting ATPase (P-type)